MTCLVESRPGGCGRAGTHHPVPVATAPMRGVSAGRGVSSPSFWDLAPGPQPLQEFARRLIDPATELGHWQETPAAKVNPEFRVSDGKTGIGEWIGRTS